MNLNTAEKVETIVLSYLHCGCTAGTFGSVTHHPERVYDTVTFYETYFVEADGMSFIVTSLDSAWCVECGDFKGEADDLWEAAALSLDGKRRKPA